MMVPKLKTDRTKKSYRSHQSHRSHWATIFALFLTAPAAADVGNLIGTQSCATATCHGATGADAPMWSRSFEIHLGEDPHARAGIVLTGDVSRRIVVRLDRDAANDPVVFDNVLRTRCLSCHATVGAADCQPAGRIEPAVLGGGVSCESCHGPAGRWGQSHYEVGWKTADQTAAGFRDNDTVLQRADNCVRCHIGSRRADGLVRDVNHDLIAAGHPPLRFDLLRYTENQSRHWDIDSWAAGETSPRTRTRLVGSAVALAAAAELSAQRLIDHQNGESDVPHPELADYDCFGCHRTITPSTYRTPAGGLGEISGGLPVWNAWYSVVEFSPRGRQASLQQYNPMGVTTDELLSIQKRTAQYFRQKAESLAGSPVDVAEVLNQIRDRIRPPQRLEWNMAAGSALTLRAVAMDRWEAPPEQAATLLDAVDRSLRFAAESDSSDRRLSPGRFDPDLYRRPAAGLINLLMSKSR